MPTVTNDGITVFYKCWEPANRSSSVTVGRPIQPFDQPRDGVPTDRSQFDSGAPLGRTGAHEQEFDKDLLAFITS